MWRQFWRRATGPTILEELCEEKKARLAALTDLQKVVAAHAVQQQLGVWGRLELDEVLLLLAERAAVYAEHVEIVCKEAA